jgi:hypothetical protein
MSPKLALSLRLPATPGKPALAAAGGSAGSLSTEYYYSGWATSTQPEYRGVIFKALRPATPAGAGRLGRRGQPASELYEHSGLLIILALRLPSAAGRPPGRGQFYEHCAVTHVTFELAQADCQRPGPGPGRAIVAVTPSQAPSPGQGPGRRRPGPGARSH